MLVFIRLCYYNYTFNVYRRGERCANLVLDQFGEPPGFLNLEVEFAEVGGGFVVDAAEVVGVDSADVLDFAARVAVGAFGEGCHSIFKCTGTGAENVALGNPIS